MFKKLLERITKVMGQAHTTVHENLLKYGGILGQLTVLRYQDFLHAICELNEIAGTLHDSQGKKLQFEVKRGTDNTVLWKSTVRVRCKKLNNENQVELTRIMNLHQFVQLYNSITRCVTSSHDEESQAQEGTSQMLTGPLEASAILKTIGGFESDISECCICMDARTDIILTCNHMYCEKCIDKWNVNHHQCPICRQEIKNKEEPWVLPEKPDDEEVAKYLIGVADKMGHQEPNVRPV
ncbi:RING finger protein 141-like isoform X1 [Saccoglossus kowalevskii]|uniref:RING finger protein 141 n=1 Tax=Saccoglossus kowalevskii TaxID=10224 RepID=A0ABM0LXZ0_SACKO|nr:PREDICTED: RING finger protein 141-like isoform X1 [Saccoglossus kowalevskii]